MVMIRVKITSNYYDYYSNLTLKCFRTYILPTAAEKLPLAEPTHDFQRGVVAFLPVTFLEYSSIMSLAS